MNSKYLHQLFIVNLFICVSDARLTAPNGVHEQFFVDRDPLCYLHYLNRFECHVGVYVSFGSFAEGFTLQQVLWVFPLVQVHTSRFTSSQ